MKIIVENQHGLVLSPQKKEQEKETEIIGDRSQKICDICARELWLWQNPSALNSVLRGIEQAAAGFTT